MESNSTQQTISIVKAAAELHHAQQIARSLTISSKNLRTFAMRIGQAAAGLAILASFYEEYSRNSITLANKVSLMTLTSAKESVSEWRIGLFDLQLDKACTSIQREDLPDSIKLHIEQRPAREMANQERTQRFNLEVLDALAEMKKNIRSIAVIAVNSKIEAPNTGEHYGALLSMASQVEEMISMILKHIENALSFLNNNKTI